MRVKFSIICLNCALLTKYIGVTCLMFCDKRAKCGNFHTSRCDLLMFWNLGPIWEKEHSSGVKIEIGHFFFWGDFSKLRLFCVVFGLTMSRVFETESNWVCAGAVGWGYGVGWLFCHLIGENLFSQSKLKYAPCSQPVL